MHIGDGKGEIDISRDFKEQVVEPILKVTVCVCSKVDIHHTRVTAKRLCYLHCGLCLCV